MRQTFAVFCLVACTWTVAAQPPAGSTAKSSPSVPVVRPKASAPQAQMAPPQAVKDLPVRKVVLYKNGVGYFEHAGSVLGNQRVAIDFTSPQLNDVLQSLTVLDEGGGRIGGVNYNSTTPLAEQLKSLSLGMTDDPSSTELFQARRGPRALRRSGCTWMPQTPARSTCTRRTVTAARAGKRTTMRGAVRR